MSLYKRKTSQVWWCRFQVNGIEIRRSTGETGRREAEKFERSLRAELEAELPERRVRRVGLADLAGLDVERAVANGVSKKQLDAVEYAWKNIVAHFGPDVEPDEIDFDGMQDFVAQRRRGGVRGQTIRKDLQALKRGLEVARRRRWIKVLPDFPKVKSDPPKQMQRGRLHPPDVLRRWLAALSPDARDEAEFALLTGLRAAELKRLQSDWVEAAPAGVNVPAILRIPPHGSKTRRERVVGLTARALQILESRGATMPTKNHIKSRRTACKTIGYDKTITLRDLRHTYGTLALQGTGDAIAAQAALGHTELATTQRYQTSTLARTASASLAVETLLAKPSRSRAPDGRIQRRTPITEHRQNTHRQGVRGPPQRQAHTGHRSIQVRHASDRNRLQPPR